jgi:hypothetical protein
VRGQAIVLVFAVNERGDVTKVDITDTRDGGYNRQLRDTFREAKFRPATRTDGTPVAAAATISCTF